MSALESAVSVDPGVARADLGDAALDWAILRDRCPASVLRALAGAVEGDILDIGCGGGVLLRAMSALGRRVVGVDSSPAAVEVCRAAGASLPGPSEIHLCDVREFPIEPGRYAAVAAMTSLVAMRRSEMLAVLDKIKNGLRPGGVAYIEVFTTRDPIGREPDRVLFEGESTYFHPRWGSFMYLFSPGELRHRFAGFEILDYREIVTTDVAPVRHQHHEARMCCRKPIRAPAS